MGCSSCSGSGGSCGTGGGCSCGKLNVHDWLFGMRLPEGQRNFPFVEVRFKGTRKEFFQNKDNLPLKEGDVVAVESSPGHDIGVVSLVGELVRFQMKKKNVKEDSTEIKAVYRIAKEGDIEKWKEVQQLEKPAMLKSREFAKQLKLTMKINDVEFQGDRKKFTVFYTAEHRVDFRELIKMLADEFKSRVEMRQIGLRQEAGRLGGLGDCGRELCCSTWLTDFRTVNTSAARYQNLSLNPAKLSGQCGKLKCCLNYELDSYMDAIRDFPNTDLALHTEKGKAIHQKTDIFKRTMWYSYVFESGSSEQSDNWVPLPVDRVKEIVSMNKQNQKPSDLRESNYEPVVVKQPDYENVVGQDSLTRMDNKFKKKKKKKGPGQKGPGGPNAGAKPGNKPGQQSGGPKPAQHSGQGARNQGAQQGQQRNPQHQNRPKPNPQNRPPRPPQGPKPSQGPKPNPPSDQSK